MFEPLPRIIIRLLIVSALLTPGFVTPKPSYACSCIMPGTVEEEFNRVPVVFEGTVARADSMTRSAWLWRILGYLPFEYLQDRFYNRQIHFTVTQAWKGVEYDEITVQTGFGGGDCGYGFVPGNTYLVYASIVRDGDLYTGICSRTTEIGHAADDLPYLSTQPTLPLAPAPVGVAPWAGLITLTIAVAGVGGVVLRRRRRDT